MRLNQALQILSVAHIQWVVTAAAATEHMFL